MMEVHVGVTRRDARCVRSSPTGSTGSTEEPVV